MEQIVNYNDLDNYGVISYKEIYDSNYTFCWKI